MDYSDFIEIEEYYKPSDVSIRMKKYNVPDNAVDKVYIWLRNEVEPSSLKYQYVKDGSNVHIFNGMRIQVIDGPYGVHTISETKLKDQKDFFFTVLEIKETVPIRSFPGDGKPEVHYYDQVRREMHIIPRSYVTHWKYI